MSGVSGVSAVRIRSPVAPVRKVKADPRPVEVEAEVEAEDAPKASPTPAPGTGTLVDITV